MRCQVHNKLCAWRQVNRQGLQHILQLFKQKLTLPLKQHYPNPFSIKQRRKCDNLSQKSIFERRNNLSPNIFFQRIAMFAPWRSQKSVRKHKDPINYNSFIGSCSDKLCFFTLKSLFFNSVRYFYHVFICVETGRNLGEKYIKSNLY